MELPHKIFYIWRVSNYPNLKGHGGLIAEGRWHSKGQSIVYCAENIECALGEIEKNLDVPRVLIPEESLILKVRVPSSVEIVDFFDQDLPQNWRSSHSITQPIGDEWLRSVISPIAKVPSALFLGFYNFLINPTHRMSDFLEIVETTPVSSYLAHRSASSDD
jgi:RES domain-containing protein